MCHTFIITIIVVHLILSMDDLSTIFYIIVAIIYVIYSAIKKGKPKNLPQQGQEPPVPQDFGDVTQDSQPPKGQRRPTFEDLLREFTQQEPFVKEKEVYEEEIDKPSSFEPSQQPFVEEKKPASVYEQYQNVEVGNDDVLRAPSVFKAVEEDYEETSTSALGAEVREMLKSPDGLKKTILLNEIIRPKYF